MSDRNLITIDEAAERLTLARKTVARWASERRHLLFYKLGGSVRVDAESIEAYLERSKVHPLPRWEPDQKAVNQ